MMPTPAPAPGTAPAPGSKSGTPAPVLAPLVTRLRRGSAEAARANRRREQYNEPPRRSDKRGQPRVLTLRQAFRHAALRCLHAGLRERGIDDATAALNVSAAGRDFYRVRASIGTGVSASMLVARPESSAGWTRHAADRARECADALLREMLLRVDCGRKRSRGRR